MEHKLIVKTLAVFAAIVLAFSALCTLGFGAKNYAQATGEEVSVELVSSGYDSANLPVNASLYNFTPMDFSLDSRMSGKSVKPTSEENGTFDVSLQAEHTQTLDASHNYALCLWVYFPSVNIFNLEITLAGASGSMVYAVTSDVLASIIAKPNDSLHSQDLETDGYGWNYLEIPFSAFNKTNAISGGNYIEFETIRLRYLTSSELVSQTLLFYDISIEESNVSSAIVKNENKQPYRLFKFDSGLDFSAIFLGDVLQLPAKSVAIKYAYIGEDNVLENTTNYSIDVKVKTSEEETPWEWSGSFTFNTEGAVSIIVAAAEKSSGNKVLIKTYSFGVYEFVGLSIFQNITTFYVGQKIAIYVSASNKLTSFDNLHFEIEGESAKILNTNTAEKYVEIEIVKKGNFKLVATATGAREYDASIGLVAEKSFVAKEVEDGKSGVKIALWVALGLVAAACVGLGIKAIIDANKYSVR